MDNEESALRIAAENALERSVDDLLAEIDEIEVSVVVPEALGVKEAGGKVVQEMKLMTLWGEYQQTICENENVRKIFESEEGDRRLNLVCTIARLLPFGNAVSVAALIVKEAFLTMCKPCWSKDNAD